LTINEPIVIDIRQVVHNKIQGNGEILGKVYSLTKWNDVFNKNS